MGEELKGRNKPKQKILLYKLTIFRLPGSNLLSTETPVQSVSSAAVNNGALKKSGS